MNQKWRILLGISLVVMICLPIVTASIQLPTIKNSFTQSSSDRLKFIGSTQYALENIRISQRLSDIQMPRSSENIRKSDFSAMPDFSGESVTISGILKDLRNWRTSPPSQVYITKQEAIEKASTLFPGICLIGPIGADLRRISAPAYPLATNPCWVVDICGYDPHGDTCCQGCSIEGNVLSAYVPYGGHIIIDAITGEILYVDYLN
ncbi:MAG: hypothetical protein ACP5NN_07780 [Methanolinea sp.]